MCVTKRIALLTDRKTIRTSGRQTSTPCSSPAVSPTSGRLARIRCSYRTRPPRWTTRDVRAVVGELLSVRDRKCNRRGDDGIAGIGLRRRMIAGLSMPPPNSFPNSFLPRSMNDCDPTSAEPTGAARRLCLYKPLDPSPNGADHARCPIPVAAAAFSTTGLHRGAFLNPCFVSRKYTLRRSILRGSPVSAPIGCACFSKTQQAESHQVIAPQGRIVRPTQMFERRAHRRPLARSRRRGPDS